LNSSENFQAKTKLNDPAFITREEMKTKIEAARLHRQENELKDCTFSPALNPRSLKIAENSRRYSKTPSRSRPSCVDTKAASRTCPISRFNDSESVDLSTVQRRLNLDPSVCRGPLMSRDVNQEWEEPKNSQSQSITGFETSGSDSSMRTVSSSHVSGTVKGFVDFVINRPSAPKAWTINDNGEHVPIMKSSPNAVDPSEQSVGDPSRSLLSSVRRNCTSNKGSSVSKCSSTVGSESTLVSPSSVADSDSQHTDSNLNIVGEITEESPITQMREFAERKGLQVKANKKKVLYRKICEALGKIKCGGSSNHVGFDDGGKTFEESTPTGSQNEDMKDVFKDSGELSTVSSNRVKVNLDPALDTKASEESTQSCVKPVPNVREDEVSVLDVSLSEGVAMRSALSARVIRLKAVRGLWANAAGIHQRSVALQRATEADDCGVLADLLSAIPMNGDCGALDLEAFALLLRPAGLPRLLSGGHQPHLIAGLRALLPLLHRLGPLVAMTAPEDAPGVRSVNVALDERRGRCDAVAEGLVSVKAELVAAERRFAGSSAAALVRACAAAITDIIDTRHGGTGAAH
jgi:hypothetical protein